MSRGFMIQTRGLFFASNNATWVDDKTRGFSLLLLSPFAHVLNFVLYFREQIPLKVTIFGDLYLVEFVKIKLTKSGHSLYLNGKHTGDAFHEFRVFLEHFFPPSSASLTE